MYKPQIWILKVFSLDFVSNLNPLTYLLVTGF